VPSGDGQLTRIAITSVWACFVLIFAGSAVSYNQLTADLNGLEAAAPLSSGTETVKIRQVSVPMMRDGVLQGYIVAKFSAIVSIQKMKHLRTKIEDLMVDEIIKQLFSMSGPNASYEVNSNLKDFTVSISREVNRKAAMELVHDILVNEFAFIEKNQARR
jgi:hypothetical protein